MKISINNAENILQRINTIYQEESVPNNIQISEFDDPTSVISTNFKKWAVKFTENEHLLQHALQIKNTLDDLYQKQKLFNDINTLNKINSEIQVFEQLARFQPTMHKNKILGQLTKRGKNETDMATVSSSVFSEDSIKEFQKQLNVLKTQQQDLLEQINNKKNKKLVELSESTALLLQTESLLQLT